MTHRFSTSALCLATSLLPVSAEEAAAVVPLERRATGTYYVTADPADAGAIDMLVDTGSEYSVINEDTLDALGSRARYVRDVIGVLADGREMRVPVYRLSHLTVGCCCVIADVEVAVFAGRARQILGLSVLRSASPIGLSFEPAELALGRCEPPAAITPRAGGGADREMASLE